MYLDATRAALTGQSEEASERFRQLISLWEPVAFKDDLTCVQATFAMLVGQDDPAAASAAQAAHDWLTETGTNSYLGVYAEGLPEASSPQAVAR